MKKKLIERLVNYLMTWLTELSQEKTQDYINSQITERAYIYRITVGPSARTRIVVSYTEVLAARLKVKRDAERGRETDKAIRAIAEAELLFDKYGHFTYEAGVS